MLLQLFSEMWQAVISSRYEHLWAIFAVLLFDKEPVCLVGGLQNRYHPWLFLLFVALHVGSELIRHLAELCDTLLQDWQLGDEGLRHELLVLLGVFNLTMVLSRCRRGHRWRLFMYSHRRDRRAFLLDLVFWIRWLLLVRVISCCRQRLLRGRRPASFYSTLLLRCLLIMFTELVVWIIILIGGREKVGGFLAHISRDQIWIFGRRDTAIFSILIVVLFFLLCLFCVQSLLL